MIRVSRFLMVLLIGVAIVSFGCAAPGKRSTRPAIPLSGRVMIVSTVNLADQKSAGGNATCPISGRVVRPGPVGDGAAQYLTDALVSAMNQLPNISLLLPSQADGAISRIMALPGEEASDARMWRHAGRMLAAEHFAVISLYRFKERVGLNYGVDEPASVAFGIHLVRVGDGAVVWSGWYDETQKPLNQNLLHLGAFIKRKGKWVTAREMADQAVADMIEKMAKK